MVLQSFLIERVFNPIGKLMQKLRVQTRDTLFVLGLLLIFLQNFFYYTQFFAYRYLITFAIGCCGLGLMLLSRLTGNLKPVRFRLLPTLLLFLFAATIILSTLINKFDYLPEALLLLLAYPLYYFLSAQSETACTFRLLLRSCEISFYVFLPISAFLFPALSRRYGGLFANVNSAAFYLQLAAICFLIDLIYEERFSFRCVLKAGFGAIAVALLFYTNSRTGMLSYLFALVFVLALYLAPRRFHISKAFAMKLLVYILLIALFLTCILQIFYALNHAPYWIEKNIHHILFPSDPSSSLIDPSEEDTKLDIASFIDVTINKTQLDGKDLDTLSTRRVSIWKQYVSALNLKGHADPIPFVTDYGYMVITSYTTHMTLLQAAYDYGILSGLIFLAFNLLSGGYAVHYAYHHPHKRYACLPLAVTVLFGVTSLLASMTTSFNHMLLLYYYLVQIPLFIHEEA